MRTYIGGILAVLLLPALALIGFGVIGGEAAILMAYCYALAAGIVLALGVVYSRLRDAVRTEALRSERRTGRRLDVLFSNLEALGWLQKIITPALPLPPTRGDWAVSPDFLATLARVVLAQRPRLILELGSGVSTLFVAYLLRLRGEGVLYSVDHSMAYLESTRRSIREHGLEGWVRLVHSPLEPVRVGGQEWQWYRAADLDLADIDLLIVDGPPASGRTDARYPALPMLVGRLAEEAVILLDDYAREGERAVVRSWLREIPGLTLVEELASEQGTAILMMRQRSTRPIETDSEAGFTEEHAATPIESRG